MNGAPYRRILVRLSGEALMEPRIPGIHEANLDLVVHELSAVTAEHVQVAVLLGAGNVMRGFAGVCQSMERSTADYLGILASLLNAIALQHQLAQRGVPATVLSTIQVPQLADVYAPRTALRELEAGRLLLLAGAIGVPFFTLDQAGAVRALELRADAMVKVIPSSPRPGSQLTFSEALSAEQKPIDTGALVLCRDNNLKAIALPLGSGQLVALVRGKRLGAGVTLVAADKSTERQVGRRRQPKGRQRNRSKHSR